MTLLYLMGRVVQYLIYYPNLRHKLELDAILVEDDNMSLWPEARGYADACVGMDGETMYIFGGLTAGGE